MAVLNIRPRRESDTAVTAATNGATADVDFTVPAGKRWLVDTVQLAVDLGVNGVPGIFHVPDGGAEKKIWDEADGDEDGSALTNITNAVLVRLLDRFARAVEMESGDILRVRIRTDEAVAKTLTADVWVIESDE